MVGHLCLCFLVGVGSALHLSDHISRLRPLYTTSTTANGSPLEILQRTLPTQVATVPEFPGMACGRRQIVHAAMGAASVLAASPSIAFAADSDAPPVKLSRAQIEGKLSRIPVVALVNEDDSPYFAPGRRVGYFYLDPNEALLNLRLLRKSEPNARIKVVTIPEVYYSLVRGEQGDVGGVLRLRPSRRQVVQANRALGAQKGSSNSLLPTVLDEEKGQVPLFYSERVSFEDANGVPSFPFFLVKEDLDAAYEELQAKAQPSAAAPKSKGEATGIPIGLTRIATLDGLVDQMTRGDIDLSQAVVVGSKDALRTVRQLVLDASVMNGAN